MRRTVIILNANPNADALHPDAVYRVNIDNDGDYLTDIAFSYVFSRPDSGRQTVDVYLATIRKFGKSPIVPVWQYRIEVFNHTTLSAKVCLLTSRLL